MRKSRFTEEQVETVLRSGREILITPKCMRLPSTQFSDAIGW